MARGRYLLLLNPDSVVLGDALDVLVAFMDAHLDVGICAPRNLDGTGALRRNCARIATPIGYIYGTLAAPFQPGLQQLIRRVRPGRDYDLSIDAPMDVQVVHGNSLCIRRELYQVLNGLDEVFFMYIEDVKRQGWRTVYLPSAQVTHYGGHSSAQRGLPRLNGMIVAYATSARYHYVIKNYGRAWLWLLRAACVLSGLCWIGMSFAANPAGQRKEKRAIGRALLKTRPPKSPQAISASEKRLPATEPSA